MAHITASNISEVLKRQLESYTTSVDVRDIGTVISIGDGIAHVDGLKGAMAGELLEFPGGVRGHVFVDIGDEQSVENDLSTFSSHIQRLAGIIMRAGERSLVLIDEIGTGTDPAEGSALGAAILEELTRRSAHVIATTHHGMLKAFAHEHPRMQNAAMEFDVASLQPTYRFRAGLPGSSYAFEITRRHYDHVRLLVDTRRRNGQWNGYRCADGRGSFGLP